MSQLIALNNTISKLSAWLDTAWEESLLISAVVTLCSYNLYIFCNCVFPETDASLKIFIYKCQALVSKQLQI